MKLCDFSTFMIMHSLLGDFFGIHNCRMAAFMAQEGRCYVTGRPLLKDCRELHHRHPESYGGKDDPWNLVYLEINVHHLIHAYDQLDIDRLLGIVKPTSEQLWVINQLRFEAFRKPIKRAHTAGVAA